MDRIDQLRMSMIKNSLYTALSVLFVLLLSMLPIAASAHGSVTADGDICYIEFGFYSAHFKIYQPQQSRYGEFCEDIPDVTESIFVMEFLHDSLREVPIDFRIVRDYEERGRFVAWEDLEAIDIEAITVFHQAEQVNPDGVFAILHEFSEAGDHIGIVTTRHPTDDIIYRAVFPFRVGGFKWGTIPWFIALAILLVVGRWAMTAGSGRKQNKKLQIER